MAQQTEAARDAVDEPAWRRLITLHGRIEHELAKVLQRRFGLGLTEYRALSRLAEVDGCSLRMQVLADAIGLNQSSVSRLVARLEEAGLTVRDPCENDRRGVYSMLTVEGRERQALAEPVYRDTLRAALDRAAADPDLGAAVNALRSGLAS
ncbi:DNA-binding MarR family transcriptional regulator [Crossiella equi]|uniref:DNA-binding MarR family transcriptional regulator n=1 Tax=Crossiella equi TaxID=130796 RepID=A0ABS5ANY3_9PSEU|nr:MarR family transcriptional regulator [Crossiella equi]MBP2478250.1 DNA-binding MarR family transcriptional regulator [Crossiella equi]